MRKDIRSEVSKKKILTLTHPNVSQKTQIVLSVYWTLCKILKIYMQKKMTLLYGY